MAQSNGHEVVSKEVQKLPALNGLLVLIQQAQKDLGNPEINEEALMKGDFARENLLIVGQAYAELIEKQFDEELRFATENRTLAYEYAKKVRDQAHEEANRAVNYVGRLGRLAAMLSESMKIHDESLAGANRDGAS